MFSLWDIIYICGDVLGWRGGGGGEGVGGVRERASARDRLTDRQTEQLVQEFFI